MEIYLLQCGKSGNPVLLGLCWEPAGVKGDFFPLFMNTAGHWVLGFFCLLKCWVLVTSKAGAHLMHVQIVLLVL